MCVPNTVWSPSDKLTGKPGMLFKTLSKGRIPKLSHTVELTSPIILPIFSKGYLENHKAQKYRMEEIHDYFHQESLPYKTQPLFGCSLFPSGLFHQL